LAAQIESENHFHCCNGLKLVQNLLDFEFNKEAENFIRVFCSSSLTLLSEMVLSIAFFLIFRGTRAE